jgi:hypothetical protein
MPPPADVIAEIQRLEASAADNVTDQHVVSRALLGQFTEPWGAKQERLLAGLDLERVNDRPTYGGPKRFGKVPNFITFASKSAEAVWQETENKLRAVLDAIANKSLFNKPACIEVIRDTFVLHFVRSIPAALIHESAWTANYNLFRQYALQFPAQLGEIYYNKYGIYPTGPEARNAAVEVLFAETTKQKERGALFRAGLEDKYKRYRQLVAGYEVKILSARKGDFLIGDVPALTIKYGHAGAGLSARIGLAFADELALPLGPERLAVLTKRGCSGFFDVAKKRVHRYNVMQIRNAYQHIHFRPGSGLETLIRSTKRPVRYTKLPT